MIAREDIPVLKMAQLNWTAALPVWVMASLACTSGSEENQEPMAIAVSGLMVAAGLGGLLGVHVVVLAEPSCCWRSAVWVAVFCVFVFLDVLGWPACCGRN